MKLHITENVLNQIVIPLGEKWLAAYDTEQSGFAAIKTESGAMSYVVMYRDHEGRKKQEKLAKVGSISAQAARSLARNRLENLTQQKALMPQVRHSVRCPTLADYFYAGYLPIVQANSRSHETHASLFRNHVNDQLGEKRLDEVSEEDILHFKLHLEHKLVAGGRWPEQATKTLAEGTVTRILILVRHLFNVAIRDKAVSLTHNPTYVVQLKTSRTVKGRFLTPEQLRRLLDACRQSQKPTWPRLFRSWGGLGYAVRMCWRWSGDGLTGKLAH